MSLPVEPRREFIGDHLEFASADENGALSIALRRGAAELGDFELCAHITGARKPLRCGFEYFLCVLCCRCGAEKHAEAKREKVFKHDNSCFRCKSS